MRDVRVRVRVRVRVTGAVAHGQADVVRLLLR